MRKRTLIGSAFVAGIALIQTVRSRHKHNVKKLHKLESRDYYPSDVYGKLSIDQRAKVNHVFKLILPNPDKHYKKSPKSMPDVVREYVKALDYAASRDTVTAYDLSLFSGMSYARADYLTLAMSIQGILEHTAYSVQTKDKRLSHGVNYSRRPKARRVFRQVMKHFYILKKDNPDAFMKFLLNNIAYNMYD